MKLLFLITLFVIAQRQLVSAFGDDDVFAIFTPEYYNTTLQGNHSIGVYKPRSCVKRFHACPHVGRDLRIIENPQFFGVPSKEILKKRHRKLDPEIKDQSDAYL